MNLILLQGAQNSLRANNFDIYAGAVRDAVVEIEELRAALTSIANNTCCKDCQEARLVARAALSR